MLALEATGPLRGRIKVPGDKSISHRAAILGALADGDLRISNFAPGKDVRNTLDCMRALGARVEVDGSEVLVSGTAGRLDEPGDVLDCGNSGTTMRLLAGVLASQKFTSVLTGDESLRNRPMDRIIDPLTIMGAKFSSRRQEGRAPLVIRGAHLRGIRYESPVASAQVKSAVLLAGLLSGDATSVSEPGRSRDHTERMLRAFGAEVVNLGHEIFLEGGDPGRLHPPEGGLNIPGDASSAAFMVAAALMVPGSQIELLDVGSNPTRTAFLSVLERAGAHVYRNNVRQWGGEPVADIEISGGPLRSFEVPAGEIPGLIDEIPALVLLASRAYGISLFRGVGELRVKETDRLNALIEEFGRLGVDLESVGDDLVVRGGGEYRGARVDSRGDHRMAMVLTLAGLAGVEVDVEGGRSVDISYPGFADDLEEIGVRVRRPRPRGMLGIIGFPAKHSLSPAMFGAAFEAAGLDWDYRVFEVFPENLEGAIAGIRSLGLDGVNVTVPFKERVLPLLDAVDDEARRIGAVNVVVNVDGELKGYNTDGTGMLDALANRGVDPRGKSALILGAGGAARAAAFALARSEIASLHISNRTPARAEALASDVSSAHEELEISTSQLEKSPGNVDIVIQATSVGMAGDLSSPLPEGYPFSGDTVLLEMVYAPEETTLVSRALSGGATVVPGLEMLISQALRGFELFTGFPPPRDSMRDALRGRSRC